MDCVKVTAGSFGGSRTNYNRYFSYLKCAGDVFVQIWARCNRFLWLGFGLHQFLPQKDLQSRNQQIIFRGGLMAFSLIPPSDLICNLWKEFCEIFFKKTIKQRRREVGGNTTETTESPSVSCRSSLEDKMTWWCALFFRIRGYYNFISQRKLCCLKKYVFAGATLWMKIFCGQWSCVRLEKDAGSRPEPCFNDDVMLSGYTCGNFFHKVTPSFLFFMAGIQEGKKKKKPTFFKLAVGNKRTPNRPDWFPPTLKADWW